MTVRRGMQYLKRLQKARNAAKKAAKETKK